VKQDPLFSLTQAAVQILAKNMTLGQAFADLSVTGRETYNAFAKHPPTTPVLLPLVQAVVGSGVPKDQIMQACDFVLDRAYGVANIIRQPSSSPARQKFGWIGLSAESDMAYRPVNVPSTNYPQHDLAVRVPVPVFNNTPPPKKYITVNTRYFVAQTSGNVPIPQGGSRSLPPTPVPPKLLENSEIFLYVHGMDSRAEEAEQLSDVLMEMGKKMNRNFTVISVDLPSSGYADKINHFDISSLYVMYGYFSSSPSIFSIFSIFHLPS
jgi:hypothetical protein